MDKESKDLATVLIGAAGLLDTIKAEWGESWSDFDQSIRVGITFHLEKMLNPTYVKKQAERNMRIVETDNFGGDYPNEKFWFWSMSEVHAKQICDALNASSGENAAQYWKVVRNDYELVPGFQP